MRPITTAVLALAMHFGNMARAGDLVAVDILISPPSEALRRGDIGRVSFSLRNTSGGALDIATAGFTFRTSGPQSTLIPFSVPETSPCFYAVDGGSPRPGEPGANGLTLMFLPWPVQPGELRSCTIGFRVSQDAAGPFVQRFSFTGISGTQSQNVALHFLFPLGDPPPLVPTLSSYVLWLLGAAMAVLGWAAMRR